jgi:hypothetical protein
MDFLSLYLYNILIKKVFNSEFNTFSHSQRVTCYEGLIHFFVGNSWNGGIHSGTVENNLYSGVSANVNGKVVRKNKPADLIPVFSIIEFLNDKVKDVFFSLNDNFSLQNANVAHKTHILTCLTYLINKQFRFNKQSPQCCSRARAWTWLNDASL